MDNQITINTVNSGLMQKRISACGSPAFFLKALRPGMTLLELIVAVVIFTIAMLPIMGVFGRGAVVTQMTNDYISAMQMSSSYLRGIVNLPITDVPIGNPVPLDKEYGSGGSKKLLIPSKVVLNGNEFTNRLQVVYVMRDSVKKDLWFDFMTEPGKVASMTVYKQLLRLDFEVKWKSKNDGREENLKLFAYKADLE
ncbi:MAG: prepilin-type N-terminal cleavage/methylation domain-containing protein [Candidatus Riflebacteria bacterium]|nr:prepilin-type N-terminal cleavage/methylation domain-containing protein [Candidatus Riflebacteria bacterium]